VQDLECIELEIQLAKSNITEKKGIEALVFDL